MDYILHITDFSFLYNNYIGAQRIKLIIYFNEFSLSQYLTSDDFETNPIIYSINSGLSQEAYFMYPTIRPYGLRTKGPKFSTLDIRIGIYSNIDSYTTPIDNQELNFNLNFVYR